VRHTSTGVFAFPRDLLKSPKYHGSMSLRSHWSLDPDARFLNHGSFGACPTAIRHRQQALCQELESAPTPYMIGMLPERLDAARERVASFLKSDPRELAFVRNATEGVNAVLSSFPLQHGDEVLTTSFGYPACLKAARRWCESRGANLVAAPLEFPVRAPSEVLAALRKSHSARTKLLLIDHVTSGTGLVFPLEEILSWAKSKSLPTLVDGAHAPGMLELNLSELGQLGATFYTGNFHKWCCSPKGAAFLWVSPNWSEPVHPTVISHGFEGVESDRPKLWSEFDWTGTDDHSAWLCAPESIDYLEQLVEGGWSAIRQRNNELLREGVALVDSVLKTGVEPHRDMLGMLWALPFDGFSDNVRRLLWEQDKLDVFIAPHSMGGPSVLRLSAFLYNELDDYRRLAERLKGLGDS